VIAMRVRDEGPRYRPPRVDVKVAGWAVQAVSGFLQHTDDR